VVTKRL